MATTPGSVSEHATFPTTLHEGDSPATAPNDRLIHTPPEVDLPPWDESPFRFLDLPAELRCMVYEQIDYEIYRHKFSSLPYDQFRPWPETSSMTLVSKTLPISLLLTSRQIDAEAKPFPAPKLGILQENERFHFVIDVHSIRKFSSMSATSTGLMRIVVDEHNARDIAPLSRILPESYQVVGQSIARDTQMYADIQAFARKCLTALLHRYPKTTTMAINFTSDHREHGRRAFINDVASLVRRTAWGRLLPSDSRICDMQTLAEEGREFPLLLQKDGLEE
jgi:hypothetical protein